MKYFVEYNAKYIAEYKTIKGCINLINKKQLKDDENNCLCIIDENGVVYSPITGDVIELYNE